MLLTQPSHVVFVHRFSFLCRTIPDIECHFQPLENCIRSTYIPSLTGRSPPSDLERDLLGLPPRLGGLGITNPITVSTGQFSDSTAISVSLSNLIKEQRLEYPFECIDAQITVKKTAHQQRQNYVKESASVLRDNAPAVLQRAMDLAQEKGASSWFTTLPLKEFNFALHKGAFRDAVALRYGWQSKNIPTMQLQFLGGACSILPKGRLSNNAT